MVWKSPCCPVPVSWYAKIWKCDWGGLKILLLCWLVSSLCRVVGNSEQQNKKCDGWTSLHLHLIILSPSLCQESPAAPAWILELLFEEIWLGHISGDNWCHEVLLSCSSLQTSSRCRCGQLGKSLLPWPLRWDVLEPGPTDVASRVKSPPVRPAVFPWQGLLVFSKLWAATCAVLTGAKSSV